MSTILPHDRPTQGATLAADEVARFDALAVRWWEPDGPMRPLHRMNPARIGWIAARVRERFADRPNGTAGLRLLDVGCGAGIAAEALARLGFDVLGLDAAPAPIAAAVAHAKRRVGEAGLALAYRVGVAEDLLAEGVRFP